MSNRMRNIHSYLSEIRFTKVKHRELNKFNNLLNKKEGNTTGVSTQLNTSLGLVTSQADRQAGAHLPPQGKGSSLASLAGRHSFSFPGRQPGKPLTFPPREGSNLASQAGRQAVRQSGSHLAPQAGSQQVLTFPSGKEAV